MEICYFLLKDQKKVTKEKSSVSEKLPKFQNNCVKIQTPHPKNRNSSDIEFLLPQLFRNSLRQFFKGGEKQV